ncbi:nucleic acid-binding protein [Spirochaetia bacterium]|nr:nucleic acid-binding protein [Spirochaetia bacterium]
MIIVCDSAPLLALAVCGQLDLLEKLYNEVLIPEAVFQEATVSDKPYADTIAEWAQGKIVEITDTEFFLAVKPALHKGEAEAITLYKEKSADFLLIDEKKGRKVAEYYDVKIIGTIGLLLKAKQEGILPRIKPYIELLQQSTIRIAPELYQRALERAGENKSVS